jgi:hypothetical protein
MRIISACNGCVRAGEPKHMHAHMSDDEDKERVMLLAVMTHLRGVGTVLTGAGAQGAGAVHTAGERGGVRAGLGTDGQGARGPGSVSGMTE